MFTWYSVTRPSAQRTCCSLIHAPRTFRSVLADRVSPCWIASSKLFADVALISVTFATDIHNPLFYDDAKCGGDHHNVLSPFSIVPVSCPNRVSRLPEAGCPRKYTQTT